MPPPRLFAALRSRRYILRPPAVQCRSFSTSHQACEKEDRARLDFNHSQALRACQTSSSRLPWIHDAKKRIGKCVISGLDEQGGQLATAVLKELGKWWRRLIIAEDGFLTGYERGGVKRQAVLWGEMDSMRHVNNVTYSRYAETGRIDWVLNFARYIDPAHNTKWTQLMTPNGSGLILKSLYTQFKFPITWPDNVSIYHRLHALPRPGDTSFVLDVVILSEKHQRIAAQCVEDIVMYDYVSGKKTPLEVFMLDMFKKTWEEQEAEKQWCQHRQKSIERTIRHLEYMSWDEDGWEEVRKAKGLGPRIKRVAGDVKDPKEELRDTIRDLMRLVEKSDTGHLQRFPAGKEILPREEPNARP